MPRRKEKALLALFREYGYPAVTGTRPPKHWDNRASTQVREELVRVYRLLRGILPEPPLVPGPLDIDIGNAFVEMDEEQHFHTYRALTLESSIYNLRREWADYYMSLCRWHESAVGRGVGFWSNSSADKQFGPSASPGVLTGNGSSRWKQRAYYDLVKDAFGLVIGKPVIRLSVWDRLPGDRNERLLGQVLDIKPSAEQAESVLELLKRRWSDFAS